VIWPGKAKKSSQQHVNNQLTLKDLIDPKNEQEYRFFDLCRQMLTYDPNKRITARQALNHLVFKEEIVQ